MIVIMGDCLQGVVCVCAYIHMHVCTCTLVCMQTGTRSHDISLALSTPSTWILASSYHSALP